MMEREFSMYETALCHVQGELFTLAWDKGYVMRDFIPAFMHSESAARVDSPYSQLQWCGEEYLLSAVVRECLLFPNPVPGPEDREALYWTGYLYRYWHFLTGETSKEIYATADFERMLRVYPGYHTLSCEMAISRLKEEGPRAKVA